MEQQEERTIEGKQINGEGKGDEGQQARMKPVEPLDVVAFQLIFFPDPSLNRADIMVTCPLAQASINPASAIIISKLSASALS